jgi:hypothetical protein
MSRTSSASAEPSVYFDNCLVGAVVNGDHPSQMAAISTLFGAHEKGAVALSASTQVLKEIRALPTQHQGPHLKVWDGLKKLQASKVTWINEGSTNRSVTTDPLYAKLEHVLTDPSDRLHVFYAAKRGVQYFATVDQRTILNKKQRLESIVSMKFGTPMEVVGYIGLHPST